MRIIGGGMTDPGRSRDHNEDFLAVEPKLGLYVVADGVGGQALGEVASRTAAEAVVDYIQVREDELSSFDGSPGARSNLVHMMEDAVQAACERVHAEARTREANMATTLTALLVAGDAGVVGHVGDSRLYLMRAGEVHQLTEDHTYVAELAKRGALDQAENPKDHPMGNVLLRAVGQQRAVQVDTLLFDVAPGDSFLLCSDGLSRHVFEPEELGQNLVEGDPKAAAAALVALANERGGKDNITAIVVRAQPDPARTRDDKSGITMAVRANTLRYVSLFQQLEQTDVLRIVSASEKRALAAGEAVIREGEVDDCVFVALEGTLSVVRAGRPIAQIPRGAHFGEMALFDLRPRSATVVAAEPAQVLVLRRHKLLDLLRQEPVLGVKLLWRFAHDLSLRLDATTKLVSGGEGPQDTVADMPLRGPRTAAQRDGKSD